MRWQMSAQCPKKKVHSVRDQTSASQVGSQDATVGAIGSYFDFGMVEQASASQEVPEEIRSVGGQAFAQVGSLTSRSIQALR